MNKVFIDLMSSAPVGESSKRAVKDKGKSVPRTPVPPESIEPLAVVLLPATGQPGPSEKKKSKRGSDRSSSQRSLAGKALGYSFPIWRKAREC